MHRGKCSNMVEASFNSFPLFFLLFFYFSIFFLFFFSFFIFFILLCFLLLFFIIAFAKKTKKRQGQGLHKLPLPLKIETMITSEIELLIIVPTTK